MVNRKPQMIWRQYLILSCKYPPLHVSVKWVPSKHKTFIQCWFTVGPPSATLAQQWTNLGQTRDVHPRLVYRWPTVCDVGPETFTQGWFTVGPPSATVGQQWTNLGWTSRVCWALINMIKVSLDSLLWFVAAHSRVSRSQWMSWA